MADCLPGGPDRARNEDSDGDRRYDSGHLVGDFLWIPIAEWIIALIMVAVGLPLSIVGFRAARRAETGAGMAIAGIVLNVVALGIIGLVIAFLGSIIGISILSL